MFRKSLAAVALVVVLSAAGGAAQAQVNFKMGMATGPASPQSIAARKFVDLMRKETGGKIDGKVYMGGSLGGTMQLLQSMVLGTVQCTVTVALSSYIPKSAVFLLPYLFESEAQFHRVTDNDTLVDRILAAGPAKGLRVLSVWDSGFRQIWTRSKPIKSLVDLKGLKIRVPEAKIWVDTFKAFGVNPTPMPYPEVYSAMQQGVIDGLEQPVSNYYTNKLFEVGRYMAKVDYMAGPAFLIVSEKWWQSLTPAERKAAMAAAKEARTFERKLNSEEDAKDLKLMEAKGLVVTTPALAPFRKAARQVWKEYEPKFGKKLIERISND